MKKLLLYNALFLVSYSVLLTISCKEQQRISVPSLTGKSTFRFVDPNTVLRLNDITADMITDFDDTYIFEENMGKKVMVKSGNLKILRKNYEMKDVFIFLTKKVCYSLLEKLTGVEKTNTYHYSFNKKIYNYETLKNYIVYEILKLSELFDINATNKIQKFEITIKLKTWSNLFPKIEENLNNYYKTSRVFLSQSINVKKEACKNYCDISDWKHNNEKCLIYRTEMHEVRMKTTIEDCKKMYNRIVKKQEPIEIDLT